MRLYDQLRLNWPPQAAAALAVCVPNAEAHALTNALYRSELGSRLRAASTATDAVSLLHKGSAVMAGDYGVERGASSKHQRGDMNERRM